METRKANFVTWSICVRLPDRIWVTQQFQPVNRIFHQVGSIKEKAEVCADTKAVQYARVDSGLMESEIEELEEILDGHNPIFVKRVLAAIVHSE
jgi:hypothetical protein